MSDFQTAPSSFGKDRPAASSAPSRVIGDLSDTDKQAAVDLLLTAFDGDPFFVELFGRATSRAPRLTWAARTFVSVLYDLTGLSGGVPRGMFEEGTLVGVALVQPPQRGRWRPALTWARTILRFLWFGCVAGARRLRLLSRYSAACRSVQEHHWIHYVMMLAVLPERQGSGVGRELLQDTFRSSEAHPFSQGIGLNTENAENVGFYLNLGFEEVGAIPFPGFIAHCMYRARGVL